MTAAAGTDEHQPLDKLSTPKHLKGQEGPHFVHDLQHAAEQHGDIVVTEEQLDYMYAHLPEEYKKTEAAFVKMFVRATHGNLPVSVKRLIATLKWREVHKPESTVCKACAKDPRSHYMHLVGYDNLERPVLYSCNGLAGNRVYQDNHDHMIQTFEMAIKVMPPGVEQWIWVLDFHGFGIRDVNPTLAKAFLDVSAEHYPERLGLFLLVDAPTVFTLLWRAIEMFIDPKTYKKIRFLPFDLSASNSKLRTELSKNFDPLTQEWLEREMSENRDKTKAKVKSYKYSDIHAAARAGEFASACKACTTCQAAADQEPAPAEEEAGAGGQARTQPAQGAAGYTEIVKAALGPVHDPRGAPCMLAKYHDDPSCLEPQATTPPPK